MSYVEALQEQLDDLRKIHQDAVAAGNTSDAQHLEKAVLSLAERVVDLRTVAND